MEIDGRLEGLQPYEIHGTRYYRVFYSHLDAPDRVLQCQLPFDALYPDAAPGDPVRITYLLNTVAGIARREA